VAAGPTASYSLDRRREHVPADAKSGWNKPLADQLRAKIVDTAKRK
jgi:hypothetical protein